jgi:hypothetical protein
MTLAGFAAVFFFSRVRRAASAMESWDCAEAVTESKAEAKTTEKTKRDRVKRIMMRLLMEGGIGSILKIRSRNTIDNAGQSRTVNQTTSQVGGLFEVAQQALPNKIFPKGILNLSISLPLLRRVSRVKEKRLLGGSYGQAAHTRTELQINFQSGPHRARNFCSVWILGWGRSPA